MREITNTQALFLAHWILGYDIDKKLTKVSNITKCLNRIKTDVQKALDVAEERYKNQTLSKKETEERLGYQYLEFMAAVAYWTKSPKGEFCYLPEEWRCIDGEWFRHGALTCFYSYKDLDYFELYLVELIENNLDLFKRIRQHSKK